MKKIMCVVLAFCIVMGLFFVPAFASEEADLFPTARVYVSSYYSTTTVKPGSERCMCDNDINTYWATKEGGNSQGRMIVDLGKPMAVYEVQFVTNALPNCRKDFSIYLTNNGDCTEMEQIYAIDSNTTLDAKKEITIYPTTKGIYRYVVAQTNQKNLQLGFAEFRVFGSENEISDNRLFNVSGQGCGFVSSGTLSTPVIAVANGSPNIAWTSSSSNYNKGDYVYVDLGAPHKIDSVSLSFNTSSSFNANVTDKEMTRTDFQIVGRNEFSATDSGDTVLIDYKGTLAKGVGNNTNLCVLEVPDEYKDEEFRYVGIKKKPTANNGNISQMCVASFDVFSKLSDCKEAFGTMKSNYNSAENCINISFAARTAYDREYQLIAAYYDKYNQLVYADTSQVLAKASETTADQAGSEIMSAYCPAAIKRKFYVPQNDDILYAKIFLIDGLGNLRPMTQNRKTTVNYDFDDDVQLVYTNVKEYLDTPIDSALVNEFRTSDRVFTIEWEPIEGASTYTLVTSTSSNYAAPTTYSNLTEPRCDVTNLLCGGATCYWKATADNGKTATGSFKPHSTAQKPYIIKWDKPDGANSYTIYLSTKDDYSDPKVYNSETNSVPVTMLDLNTRYYWKAVSDNGVTNTGTFKTTPNAPRFITTEGTSNFRDLGGWMTSSGKRVKTGRMYRGAEANPSANVSATSYHVTENDKRVLVDELGIKTEIDLRTAAAIGSTSASPLGDSVAYYRCELSSGYGIDLKRDYLVPKFKKIFQIMGDESNYPIYFHCYGGADRTGTIAWLVNGLLGVGTDDLYRDYEITSFSSTGVKSRQGSDGENLKTLTDFIAEFSGDTMSEQIENYLLSIGITQDEIKTIKRMMLE